MSFKHLFVIILIAAINVNGFSQVLTSVNVKKSDNLSKVLSCDNRRYIIRDNFNLRGKTIVIGANSILDFQGGSISNGSVMGNQTLVIGAPYCLFDEITLSGSFRGESYPEWFNGDIQECANHFKVIRFVGEEYVLSKPLNLPFGCKLEGSSYNVLKFNLPQIFYGKGCINVGSFCEVSKFIIYVESDNPAIEIKSSYVRSSMSESDYVQRIAPATTSPGAGTTAAIHIHDLTIRTALTEKQGKQQSTVCSTSPAIWLTGGGGYVAYDRDAHMFKIVKAPGLSGVKVSNVEISGRWLIGIKCEQINEEITEEEIDEIERITFDHSLNDVYWETHNKDIIRTLRKDHRWGYGWITGCTFDNIQIHTVMGGIWLGREHLTDGHIISRGNSIQHFIFNNVQMQFWKRINKDNTINIGPKYFVKLNNCNGVTFTNCEPWDWPISTTGVEKPFQIDDSYNVWNVTFQGYSQWRSTTTNFIQYENGAQKPLCNEHRVVLCLPEASFGLGNIAILDDYLDYSNYSTNSPETMKCNKQLRLLPPGTYSLPNLNQRNLNEFFKIDIGNVYKHSDAVCDAWLEVHLVADAGKLTGTQYWRIITLHFSLGNKIIHVTMRRDEPIDRVLKQTDWDFIL